MTIDAKTVSSVKAMRTTQNSTGWTRAARQADLSAKSTIRSMNGVTNPLFNGIKIIDCDTHFTEPPDLFQRTLRPA